MASNDISQEIQDDLSCPVCKNQLSQPKALPCQHTYCCSCLQELARWADNGQFHCPQCRKMVAIPAEGVQAFPTNFLVANILEKFQEKNQLDKCKTDLCNDHRKEAHVVCPSCDVVFCNVCMLSPRHDGTHIVKNLQQEKATRLKELKKLIKESKDSPQDLSHVKQCLQERHKDVRRQIESRAAVVIHQVESQKTSLLKELDQRREKKLKKIRRIEVQYDALRRHFPAEQFIKSNEPLSYLHISSAVTNLKYAISRGNVYYAHRALPLLGEVGKVKFEHSKVEQLPLLGHNVEGTNPYSSSTSGKADTKKGKQRSLGSVSSSSRVIENPVIVSSSEDEEDDNICSVALEARPVRVTISTASSSGGNQASTSASTSRSSQT